MGMKNWGKDGIISLLALVLLSSMFLPTEAAIDKGSIVGIWLFDAGSGNKIKDSSDNGNHGNLVNTPEWGNFPKTKPLDAKIMVSYCGNCRCQNEDREAVCRRGTH